MAFYGLSDRDVLTMPVTRFWLLNRSIDRVTAERSISTAVISAQVQSSEGFQELITGLQKQLGQIVDMDEAIIKQTEQLDRDGLNLLRNLGKVC